LPLGLQPVIQVSAVLTTAREEELIGSMGDVFARAVVHHQSTSLKRLFSFDRPPLTDGSILGGQRGISQRKSN